MARFRLTIRATNYYEVEVDALDPEEAADIATDLWFGDPEIYFLDSDGYEIAEIEEVSD